MQETTVPRVTEILGAYTNFSAVPAGILARACDRGSKVHGMCSGIAGGAWFMDELVDSELIGYVKSFRQWADKYVASYELIETRYTNSEFTGQLDFVIKAHDGELWLVDLKTGITQQKTHPVQMGAYDILLREKGIKVMGAILVYLSKDGDEPKVKTIPDLTVEREIFLSALNCYNYFKTRKRGRTRTKKDSSN